MRSEAPRNLLSHGRIAKAPTTTDGAVLGQRSRGATRGCTAASGSISYSGLSDTQGAWVLSQVLGIRNQLGLVFDCTAAPSGNLSVFACDNDGSIY
jgi:hypothetical protein